MSPFPPSFNFPFELCMTASSVVEPFFRILGDAAHPVSSVSEKKHIPFFSFSYRDCFPPVETGLCSGRSSAWEAKSVLFCIALFFGNRLEFRSLIRHGSILLVGPTPLLPVADGSVVQVSRFLRP